MEIRLLFTILSVLGPVALYYLYNRSNWNRFQKYAHIPSAPDNSLIWGHLKEIGDRLSKGPPSYHSDYVFEEMHEEAGKPEIMLVDLRPLRGVLGVIFNHELAEQISKPTKKLPYSVRKPDASKRELVPVLGEKNIIFAQGEEWKSLRRRYNPAFAPNHLLKLVTQIVDQSLIFAQKLDKEASSENEFCLENFCTELTFDIIGKVVLDVEFGAQGPLEQQSELVKLFRAQLKSYFVQSRGLGIVPTPWSWWARKRRAMRLDKLLKQVISEKHAVMRKQLNQNKSVKSRSVLALSVSNGEEDLNPELLQISADQVKSFLFAGHDTTSILLQRVFYALSVHPKVLATARAELYSIFQTTDPAKIADILVAKSEDSFRKMVYVSAIIKEALRLWPPAATARLVDFDNDFKLQLSDGGSMSLRGVTAYSMHHSIHRDPGVYGDTANDFIPERWLGNTSTSSVDPEHAQDNAIDAEATNAAVDTSRAQKIPASAWRPFERGPRNCIGQELANLEARTIIALVLQRYDFVKTGLGAAKLDATTGKPFLAGGDGGAAGRYELESELYNARQITSKPADGTMMKVRIADSRA